jgi:hypothetical protein
LPHKKSFSAYDEHVMEIHQLSIGSTTKLSGLLCAESFQYRLKLNSEKTAFPFPPNIWKSYTRIFGGTTGIVSADRSLFGLSEGKIFKENGRGY